MKSRSSSTRSRATLSPPRATRPTRAPWPHCPSRWRARAVRVWLGGAPPPLAAIDAVLAVAAGARRAVELPGGGRVARRSGRLVVESSGSAGGFPDLEPEAACELLIPGVASGHGVTIESWIARGAPAAWPDGRETCVVDADAVGERLWLRAAAAGERFAPLGLAGTKAVATAWREVAPASRRPATVVATTEGGPVWVVGYRIDDGVRVTSRTRRFLWMSAAMTSAAR